LYIPFFMNAQNTSADSASYFLTEYKKNSKEFNTSLWGVLIDSPVLFIDKKSNNLFLSKSIGDTNETIYKSVFIYPLDNVSNITSPVFSWKNEDWVIVTLPTSKSKEELIEFIAHESFHNIQKKLSIERSSPSLPHLTTQKGKSLIHYELQELLKAFKLNTFSETKTIHLRNALLLRKYRYEEFPEAELIEKKAELNEGLAEYTGLTYAKYSTNELVLHYHSVIKKLETMQNEISYPYLTGSLYAFLNDSKDSLWRKKIPNLSVHEITETIYQINTNYNDSDLIENLLKSEEYKNFNALFQENDNKELVEKFSNNNLTLSLEGSEVQLNSTIIISLPQLGTVYNNVIITNSWGKLIVDKDGIILISTEKNKILLDQKSIKMDENLVSGIGWKLILDKNWLLENEFDFVIKPK